MGWAVVQNFGGHFIVTELFIGVCGSIPMPSIMDIMYRTAMVMSWAKWQYASAQGADKIVKRKKL